MAIFRGSMIRGEQIKDRTIQGEQILQNALSNEHIASDAAIAETKLDINWHAHKEALEDRKIVDFVQVNGINASGTEVDLEAQVPALTGAPIAGSDNSVEGIIVEGVKNIVPMRDAVTGEPLVAEIAGIDYEVISRIEYVNSKFVLRFYTASGVNGAEVAYDLGEEDVMVDIQYAERFNLSTVDEMFAANEKFVHGAADVTAYLNIEQLAKDIYGATWKVDRDGNANLTTSLVDQIAAEKNRAQLAESALQTNINNEADARIAADTTLTTALNQETTNRIDADDALQTAIDDETTARQEADQDLTDALAAETLARTNSDNLLQTNINNEASARATADTAIRNDFASNDANKGASLVGIEAIIGMPGVTTVQDALEYLKTNAGDALTQLASDLGSTADGKGANLIAVETGHGFNGATVEAVLEDHESRLDAIETNIGTTAATRSLTANGYFIAQTFATLGARLADSETVVDANLKRIDDRDMADRTRVATANTFFTSETKATLAARFADIETIVDAKAHEVEEARGTEVSLNERLSVSMNADGTLVNGKQIHSHKKYTITMAANQTKVDLPVGQFFNISAVTGSGSIATDSVQVYINGILQANGINFKEVADTNDATKGIAIDFTPEELVVGDVIVIEWVVNNIA